ncbi:PREDICTED: uncharacterized protein LOC105969372 [Erythranthe guttata]|nr:PREDICTED: uncharacterized protein LOC105969372 [Erythranthe guttata]|eukprot:XP_012849582.1 PREDICTED: uncharacterized protein LOC105969372 [Erythranthe guttata]
MAIASPSAPNFCCTTRSESTHRRLWSQQVSSRAGSKRVSIRPGISSRLNASSDGELVYELNYNSQRRRRGAFPVYVTLPPDAVGPTAQTMSRKRAMAQSFRALAAAGVEGVVMEVWWGLVEREFPRSYNWRGYLEIVEMAKRFGLKVRAVMAFHQFGSGSDDPFWLVPISNFILFFGDSDKRRINPSSRPEGLVEQIVLAARICDVPLEGENGSTNLDGGSFEQVVKMSKFYSDGLDNPSFSFNFVRMDRNLFESRNWASFTKFVRQISTISMFGAGSDFNGGGNMSSSSPSATAAFAGAVLAAH